MKRFLFVLAVIFLATQLYASKAVGDNLGSHKAKKTINVNEHNVEGGAHGEFTSLHSTNNITTDGTVDDRDVGDDGVILDNLSRGALDLYLTNKYGASAGYYLVLSTISDAAESTITATIDGTNVLVGSFTYHVNLNGLLEDDIRLHFHSSVNSVTGVKDVTAKYALYKGSGASLSFIERSGSTGVQTITRTEYSLDISTSGFSGKIDYFTIVVEADGTGGGGDPIFTFYMEGADNTRLELPPTSLSEVTVTNLTGGDGVDTDQTKGNIIVSISSPVAELNVTKETCPDVNTSTVSAIDAGGLMLRNSIGSGGLHIEGDGGITAKASMEFGGHDITGGDSCTFNSFTGNGAGLTGISKDIWKTIPFSIPGDAYDSNNIVYHPQILYNATLASATVMVGVPPEGAGTSIKYDILFATFCTANALNWTSIFNSTDSLQLVAGSTCTATTDLAVTKVRSNWVFKVNITDIGGTRAGGSPNLIDLLLKQD